MTADHYFSAEPAAPEVRSEIVFNVAGRDYRLTVASGVFSAGRLDPGTAVLLRKGDLPGAGAAGTFLDLGCGYGPIACVLAAEAPGAVVHAVDVNARARELTSLNAQALELGDRVRVYAPDDVPGGTTYDQIWSNPPTHVGKAELHALMERWLPRLAPDGVAWLVINRNLGGDSLHAWLVGLGWSVERMASQRGFRVLKVTRKTD
ncbi:class I SAM-dependent methyltransferase [Actinoplanes sp. TRM 88003]|uniref:Class I SAM-dependent methyltransferase n=1 Tax=Paractinoplanes aksuensis TaxID=2939490 RepID=A0ABT1E0M5_9ACTN|nr:methyltransferase [Actinoplanes aksuensis]MCO8275725.1 class I SAM-dependent methyltransferase [Actinoplanes aksuensis]